MSFPFQVRDLGSGVSYADAFALQTEANEALQAGTGPQVVFLLEHAPVITVTAKQSAWANLVTPVDQLAQLGVAVAQTNRGGDITYHGPGQLVAYPILDLNRHGLSLSTYMRLLEETVIELLAGHGIQGEREAGATGVWVGGERGIPAKICAMGVRIRKGTTLHGLALNITTNMDHFKLIVPCGLAGRPVASLAQWLGDRCPPMAEVKAQWAAILAEKLTVSRTS